MSVPSKEQADKGRENWRIAREDELLKCLIIRCKVCDTLMRTGHQEGVRFYHCKNNTAHPDNQDRFVWVDMPDWLMAEAIQEE